MKDARPFPCLPLICLQTADDTTTHEVVKGKVTVIGTYVFVLVVN